MNTNTLQAALAAHQQGDLVRAEQLYRAILATGDDPDALQLLGALKARQGDHDEAIRLMRHSLRIDPGQPNVLNNLGNSLKRKGALLEATRHYREALTMDPAYLDAARNLISTLAETGRDEESNVLLQDMLTRYPTDPALLALGGRSHESAGRFQFAIELYRRSLNIRPDHAATLNSLGVSYRLDNQPRQALACFDRLLEMGVRDYQVVHNAANAHADLGDLETAMAYYREVIDLNPTFVEAHKNLGSLLWSMGDQASFLDSFERTFQSGRVTDEMILARGESLLTAERPADAIAALDERPPSDGGPDLLDLKARCLLETGDFDAAIACHEEACRLSDDSRFRLMHGITRLRIGDIERAHELLDRVFTEEPANQYALSHLAVCWRLLGDPRAEAVNNWRDLVRTYELPTPPGYSSLAEFNAHLNDCLTRLHTSREHPMDQTLRGGTQTQGNLFGREQKEIREFVNGITVRLHEHLAHLKTVPKPFPMFDTADNFTFSASWSVRLRDQGFHTMHIHPMGWFSSAYYVDLPPVIDDTSQAGWLVFGQPNFDVGLEPIHAVRPVAGQLTLFPSYLWHGTRPFTDEHPRTTIAFDIVAVS